MEQKANIAVVLFNTLLVRYIDNLYHQFADKTANY